MKIVQIPLLRDNYGYLIICQKTNMAGIIDPSEAEPVWRRVEAEIIRDMSLAASGLLSERIGGPSVRPPQPAEYASLTYAGSAKDLKPWLDTATLNRDRNLRLQYLAGMSLNTYQADPIYVSMTRYARFPEGLFTGSQETMDALRRAIRFPANSLTQ